MLAVWLFVVFWVLLGIALFFVAIRGGLGGVRGVFQTQTLSARRFFSVSFVVVNVASRVAPAGGTGGAAF